MKSVTKLQLIPTSNSTSLVYVGGCSSLPTDSNDSNVLSKFTVYSRHDGFVKAYVPLVPFGGRIVDILYLQPCEGIGLSDSVMILFHACVVLRC